MNNSTSKKEFSVFTHMGIEEIAHYLKEIKRVLKPSGLCLCTFFVYKPEDLSSIDADKSFSFSIDKGDYRLMSEEVKSANIALSEKLCQKLVLDARLTLVDEIEGYWKDRVPNKESNIFQDIWVLEA